MVISKFNLKSLIICHKLCILIKKLYQNITRYIKSSTQLSGKLLSPDDVKAKSDQVYLKLNNDLP